MFKTNKTTNTLRASLLAGAAIMISGGALAAPTPAQCNGPNPPSDCPIETVVVTGSLIERPIGDTPTPTVTLSASTILKTGHSNIADVLAQLPQVQNNQAIGGDLTSTNSNFLTSGFGVNNVDLRLLGASRTLVLINGRRQVTGSPTSSAVDLNTIPTELIDRIEVITGGASALYGSDAVAGVVNIILKRDFEGVAFHAQAGEATDHHDASDYFGNVMLGGNFADDHGNVTVAVTYDNSGPIHSVNRDISHTDSLHIPGLFERIGPSAFSSFGVAGRFESAEAIGANGQVVGVGGNFNPNGTPFVTAVNGFDRSPHRLIAVGVDRKIIAETGHYDINNWLTFFLDTAYAQTHSSSNLEPFPGASTDGLSKPTSAGGTPIIIPLSNPFIPPALLTALTTQSGGTHPPTNGIEFFRRFIDLGDRHSTADRNLGKVTLGFDVRLPFRDWKVSTYYEWGRTDESDFTHGFYDKIKLQEALNARSPNPGEVAPAGGGGFVCNDPIAQASGCVPINLFGAGSITPQAAKYVTSLITLQDQATEQVAHIEANGTVIDLPAGPAKLAVGSEYRKESADFVPDAATQAGTVAGNQIPAVSGGFNVVEVFAETDIPVLKDMPFIKSFEVDGAVRYAHYNTAGNATAWMFRGIWQPIEDLKIRATDSSATRAPNIAELFTPPAQTFPGIGTNTDPCIHPANANVQSNCNQSIAEAGPPLPGEPASPSYGGQTGQAAAQGVGGFQSGNPNLVPEIAYTFTGGGTYTPSWLPGFTATIDWYDIRLHKAIGGLSLADTLSACYNGNPADFNSNVFCQQITRQNNQQLGPIIVQINQPTFNLGAIRTSGVDFQTAYSFDLEDIDPSLANMGSLSLALNGTYLSTYETDVGISGTTPSDSAGTVAFERWRALLRTQYSKDRWTVVTTAHYVGPALADNTVGADLDGNRITSYWTFDTNVSYDINDNVQLYVGANNLFDKQPPEIFPGIGEPTSVTGVNTDPGTYDVIGRFVYSGLRVKL